MKRLFGLFALTSLFVFGGALTLKDTTVQPLFADGEISEPATSEEPVESSEPEQEQEVVEEEQGTAKQEIVDKIVNFKDTFLVPLLSGVSITSILSACFALAMAMLNRKNNKQCAAENEKIRAEAKQAFAIANEMVAFAREVVEQGKMSKETEEKMLCFVKENYEKLHKEVNDLNVNLEKVLAMKQCVIMLINLEAELAKGNPNAISNGLMQKINEINEQAKKML